MPRALSYATRLNRKPIASPNQDAYFYDAVDPMLPLFPVDSAARQQILRETFRQVEAEVRAMPVMTYIRRDGSKVRLKPSVRAGCTALVALRFGGEVIFAVMGDAVGVVLKGDGYYPTLRHEAGNKDEEARARARGAYHDQRGYWRHKLLDRSIGLQPLRSFGDTCADKILLRQPELFVCSVVEGDTVLIGSDGLLLPYEGVAPDQYDSELAVAVKAKLSIDSPAEALVQDRFDEGQRDDITAVVLSDGDGCIACFDGHGPLGERVAWQANYLVASHLRRKAFYSYLQSEAVSTAGRREALVASLIATIDMIRSYEDLLGSRTGRDIEINLRVQQLEV